MICNHLILIAFQNPTSLTRLSLAEWDVLLRQARRGGLLARLHALLEELDLLKEVPAQPRRHLVWANTIAARHTLAVQWEVAQIRQALSPTGIPLILLKGAAYVMAKLPTARGRIFSDIDIMVPKDRLNEVEAALMLHGWATTHHDTYDQHYYRTWMHELPPMQHIKRMTVLDVHHAILPETTAIHPDPAQLRAAAVRLDASGQIMTLAFVDMVLHSATHLFHDGELEQGLRDLLDIDSLLQHFGSLPSFWTQLIERARELELTRPLFYALRYATLLLHTPVPPTTVSHFDHPNRLLLALMDSLFIRALLPNHASCSDLLTGTARSLLYVRANWLRMPPLLLARHLFHKAFISPKTEHVHTQSDRTVPRQFRDKERVN